MIVVQRSRRIGMTAEMVDDINRHCSICSHVSGPAEDIAVMHVADDCEFIVCRNCRDLFFDLDHWLVMERRLTHRGGQEERFAPRLAMAAVSRAVREALR